MIGRLAGPGAGLGQGGTFRSAAEFAAVSLPAAERGRARVQDAGHEVGPAAAGNLLDEGDQREQHRYGIERDRLRLLEVVGRPELDDGLRDGALFEGERVPDHAEGDQEQRELQAGENP